MCFLSKANKDKLGIEQDQRSLLSICMLSSLVLLSTSSGYPFFRNTDFDTSFSAFWHLWSRNLVTFFAFLIVVLLHLYLDVISNTFLFTVLNFSFFIQCMYP